MKIYDAIERYLEGGMNEQERLEFERKLEADSHWKERLEEHIKMRTSLDEIVAEDIRSYIRTLQTDSDAHRSSSRVSGKLLSRIITAIVFLLIVLAYFFMNKPMRADMAFEKYYKAPVAESSRSKAEIFEDPVAVDYFRAHDYIADSDYQSALDVLERMDLNENNRWYDNVEWFELLLKLKLESSEGKKMLKEMLNDRDNEYHQEIQQLARDLKITSSHK